MPTARIALYTSSLVAVGILVRSLTIGPLPLWVAVVALGGYLGLTLLGVVRPDLEMFGDAIVSGGAGTHQVALTFDDGPHPDTTRAILQILAREGASATFFVVGERAARHPDVLREIVAGGHTLGVHGDRHAWLHALWSPGAIAADIDRARAAVERATGLRPRYFRPPIGIVSPRTAVGARRAGVPIILFDVRSGDGLIRRADTVVRRVTRRLHDGAIILLHDAIDRGARDPASVAALPILLERLEERGLRAVGIERLIEAEAGPPYEPTTP